MPRALDRTELAFPLNHEREREIMNAITVINTTTVSTMTMLIR